MEEEALKLYNQIPNCKKTFLSAASFVNFIALIEKIDYVTLQ